MYYLVGLVVLLVLAYAAWASFFNTSPSCFDNKQDGTELGVDCGGSCSLVCPDTARQPVVSWARSFLVAPGSYTLAAYVQNNNIGAGAKAVPYSFQLFDADNSLIKEVDGTADLPPVSVVPIIVPNVSVQNRVVAHVEFAFSSVPSWHTVAGSSLPSLSISEQNLSADGSRLSAILTNQTLIDAQNITVAAVLFDADGVARAASKSYVADVAAQSGEQVVFTWPSGVPNIVRAEITVLPSF